MDKDDHTGREAIHHYGSGPAVHGKAGNAANHIHVAHQTLNLGGGIEWIQSLTVEQLTHAEQRLLATSSKHEGRAVLPVLVPLLVAFIVTGGLQWWIPLGRPEPLTTDERLASLVLGVAYAAPFWFWMYDIRRRNRQIVQVAERRLAEVVVEKALRQKPANAKRQMKARCLRLRRRLKR